MVPKKWCQRDVWLLGGGPSAHSRRIRLKGLQDWLRVGAPSPHFLKRDLRKRDLFTNVMKSLMTAIEMERGLYLEETGDAQKTF